MDENLPPIPPASPEASPPPAPPVMSPPLSSAAPPRYTSAPPPTVPPVARRGGRGWMVFALILLVLLSFSFLLNLRGFARRFVVAGGPRYTHSVGPRLDEVLIEDSNFRDKIAVINLNGILSSQVVDPAGFTLVDVIKAELRRAHEDERVRAVILKLDSPGGEVLASDEISRAILDFQKKSGKPAIAAMGDVAASGGYYVAAPCRWIVANELTITGSIGVIMHTYNYRGLMDKVGVRPQVYKSGKFKDMLSGDRRPEDIPEEEGEMLKAMIDQTFNRFKEVVAAGREEANRQNKGDGRPLDDDWANYADGRVLSGKDAYDLGFVDQLGSFDDAVKAARRLARIQGASLVQYQQHYDFSDFLRLFGKTESRVLKVDLGVEAPKLKAGYLYYLCPAFVR